MRLRSASFIRTLPFSHGGYLDVLVMRQGSEQRRERGTCDSRAQCAIVRCHEPDAIQVRVHTVPPRCVPGCSETLPVAKRESRIPSTSIAALTRTRNQSAHSSDLEAGTIMKCT